MVIFAALPINQMQQREISSALNRGERRNQKNVYVKKINSLMRVSQDTLMQDEKDITIALNKKHIKKARSELDKAASKLQKNRQSAKKARLRKKLYIKLLEKRVDRLREAKEEGTRIEKDCTKFLEMISRKQQKCERNEDTTDPVERYLSSQNLGRSSKVQYMVFQDQQERESTFARMDKLVQEICQVSMCSSLRNIRQLSSQISLQQILKGTTQKQRQSQGQQLQQIISQVLMQTQNMRNLYVQLASENQYVKRSILDKINHRNHHQEANNDHGSPKISKVMPFSEFCSYFQQPGDRNNNIFINLTEGEKIIIQSQSYLSQIINECEEKIE